MKSSKIGLWESSFTPAELLNYKKLTLLQLEDAQNDFEAQGRILDMFYEELSKEIALQTELNHQLQDEVKAEREIERINLQEHQRFLGDKPQTVIGQFERSIEANLVIAEQMYERLEELELEISIAKIEMTQKLEELCLKQSQLDSIELKTRHSQEKIEQKKQLIKEIEKALHKSTAQQQQMYNLKKKLNNQLQEYKGNIRVYCRVRPRRTDNIVISTTSDNTLKLTLSKDHIIEGQEKYEQSYFFQQIFSETDTQERVFTQISQLVQSSIDGKNVCIFSYGQTGSGKTFTLLGPETEYNESISNHNQRGLTPRSIDLIFDEIALSESFRWKYSLYLSIQEIYLDTIIDLIGKCTISMDKFKEVEVFSALEVQSHLNHAKQNRKTASTNMNERSSRSHLIVTLRLQGNNLVTNENRNGSLVLIDLAGSQRLKQSKVQGDNLNQTRHINTSLSALGNVINAIRRKSDHIPFRSAKLTHVLQRYLEGDSKTLMFVNVSPDFTDVSQTKVSLSFAEGVRQCKFNKK